MFQTYLSSLNRIKTFMLAFGLLMGLVFPLYSAIFFGTGAFNPLYVTGCLSAGLFVGLFCSSIIKRALQFQLQRQFDTLSRIAGQVSASCQDQTGDELESLSACHEMMLNKVFSMVSTVLPISETIAAKYMHLTEKSREMATGNEAEAAKENENLLEATRLTDYFRSLLNEIETLSVRSDERAAIASQMSATTDAITDNIRNYSENVLNTSASIEEMAASIKEIAGNTDALSSSTEQTFNSIQLISTAINNVRDNTQTAVESSLNVRMLAQEGMRAMNATVKAMHEIEQSNEESFSAIGRLSIHSARVGEFLQVIHEIVEQTNLLSLNASIIAAQAGERGKAFGVVAEEVRSLARRTAASAGEIQELVKNIQKETAAVQRAIAVGKDRGKGGVKISAVTSDALVKIEETSTEVSQMIQKIAAATVKQSSGSRVIGEEADKNLERVRQITRAIKEQERGTTMIVNALEEMRRLSRKIAVSTEEQARGNHLYLQSVIEDNDKMKRLRETSQQLFALAVSLKECITESGALMQENTANAGHILKQISDLTRESELLQQELLPFRQKSPAP